FLLALVFVWLIDSPYILMVYMVLMGASAGSGNAIVAALQVEFFGTTYIGAVRSLFASIMVLSSAIGSAAFGFIIDAGYSLDYIFIIIGMMMLIIILQSFQTIPGFSWSRSTLIKIYYSRYKS